MAATGHGGRRYMYVYMYFFGSLLLPLCQAKNSTSHKKTTAPKFNDSTSSPSAQPTVGAVEFPPTTSYYSSSAWFLLAFQVNLESDNEEAGFLNETEIISFQKGREATTQLFAPDEEWQKVVTMCQLQHQDLNYTNETLSLIKLTVLNTTNIHTYKYLFQLTYLSTAVNVSHFPQRFLEYSMLNPDLLANDLVALLQLEPSNNLQITSIEEVIQFTEAPVVTTQSPTTQPTISPQPSILPSMSTHPSKSSLPSYHPSIFPTILPSPWPSMAPTIFPTFGGFNSSDIGNFALEFTLQAPDGAGYINTTQEEEFCQLMVNQTDYFAPEDDALRVKTQCVFFADTYVVETLETQAPTTAPSTAPTRRRMRNLFAFLRLTTRREQEQAQDIYPAVIYIYTYTFRMRYTSTSVNVTNYTDLFQQHIVNSSDTLNIFLTELLYLDESNNLTLQSISVFETKSAAPSGSSSPSESPTVAPTPKETPLPSYAPTLTPTKAPPPSILPSSLPSNQPSTLPPPPPDHTDETTIIIVVVIVSLVAAAMMAAMTWFYQKRRRAKLQQEAAHRGIRQTQPKQLATHTLATSANSLATGEVSQYPNSTPRLVISPSHESIHSHPSFLSNGEEEDDDDDHDEHDVDDVMLQRHSKLAPLDDFDRYKDQNLEKMRTSVNHAVKGMDGMMSQALTMAILGGPPSSSEMLDGTDGIEMEANALCEVTDWVKRHDFGTSTVDERQLFMQEMLNKMVTSVRQGLLAPDDASRTIHECAALLNLQLVHDLPNDTVILSGMRKSVRANDVIRAFRKFGPIEDAAVASNQRGFGLVRFRNIKTVEIVMTKFRTSEIVVQDVAVQCRTLDSIDR